MHGRGSCLPTSLPTGFSEWGLDHISHAWNSSPTNDIIIFALDKNFKDLRQDSKMLGKFVDKGNKRN